MAGQRRIRRSNSRSVFANHDGYTRKIVNDCLFVLRDETRMCVCTRNGLFGSFVRRRSSRLTKDVNTYPSRAFARGGFRSAISRTLFNGIVFSKDRPLKAHAANVSISLSDYNNV